MSTGDIHENMPAGIPGREWLPAWVAEKRQAPDEGCAATRGQIDAVRDAFGALTPEQRTWVDSVTAAANAAGTSLHVVAHPTERRIAIAQALLVLASLGSSGFASSDEAVRTLIGMALGGEFQGSVATGAAMAALTIEEAKRLTEMAQAYRPGEAAQLSLAW